VHRLMQLTSGSRKSHPLIDFLPVPLYRFDD
jgi:hypothetical protein